MVKINKHVYYRLSFLLERLLHLWSVIILTRTLSWFALSLCKSWAMYQYWFVRLSVRHFLAECYYVTFGLWHEPSVILLHHIGGDTGKIFGRGE